MTCGRRTPCQRCVRAVSAQPRPSPPPPSRPPARHPAPLRCAPQGTVVGEWIERYTYAAAGPEQYTLNYGATYDQMTISWVNSNMSSLSLCDYGTAPTRLASTEYGNSTSYTYGKYASGLIHTCWLEKLALDTVYYYQVDGGEVRSFKSNPGPAKYPFKFAITGDLGESAQAQANVDHLVSAITDNGMQLVLCTGDLSYANACEGKATPCSTWDAFQRLVEPVSGTVPWAINIGNQ